MALSSVQTEIEIFRIHVNFRRCIGRNGNRSAPLVWIVSWSLADSVVGIYCLGEGAVDEGNALKM